ncbi:translation initiation factor IF3-1, mitochondrial [Carya illinoinensis]|uniref:Translation initiation factor 3 N-terminal domain-containing protein n=1 Tax=Carya illinoinensis TaxID=32201 RepID=A0A8T1QG80_CARIL|nr:translation initiation factor IF3-1, mitochondrial [Carya illinoinensis]KAG6653538.1 hypothetical protein CIPAW_05G084400 [Carya illinoinensis]
MAFCCRISRFKPKHFSYHIQRHYLGIPNGAPTYSNSKHTDRRILENPYWVNHVGPSSFCNSVRSFAAPVQAKPKEKKDTGGPRLNEQIMASVIRLVTEEGHEKVSRHEALERARKLKLDLVEVQRNADPPVCRLMDFHREKYKQQIKEKDRAKSKSDVTLRKGDYKEVRFSGKTELKDLKMKAEQIKRLMERGYRVKCRAMGKEDQDLGGLLSRLSALIEDVSIVESGPSVRETEAHVIVRHVKFGAPKKGGGNKSKVVGDKNAKVQVVATAPGAVNSIDPIEELSSAESETEEGNFSDEVDLPIDKNLEDDKNRWSVDGATDDFDKVFQFGGDVNGATSGSTDKQFRTAQKTASPLSDINISDTLRSTPPPDFMQTNEVPSSPEGQNRYKRSEPRNQFPSSRPVDNRSPEMRDSLRPDHQFPNQRRQPPLDANFSPAVPESSKVSIDASEFRNSKLPLNSMPKREPSPPGTPNATAPGYGIFSAPNAPGKRVAAAEVQVKSEGNPYDSLRNPGTRGVSPNTNLSNLNPGDTQKPGLDKGGTKGWGVFSRESSNAMTNQTSKPN